MKFPAVSYPRDNEIKKKSWQYSEISIFINKNCKKSSFISSYTMHITNNDFWVPFIKAAASVPAPFKVMCEKRRKQKHANPSQIFPYFISILKLFLSYFTFHPFHSSSSNKKCIEPASLLRFIFFSQFKFYAKCVDKSKFCLQFLPTLIHSTFYVLQSSILVLLVRIFSHFFVFLVRVCFSAATDGDVLCMILGI